MIDNLKEKLNDLKIIIEKNNETLKSQEEKLLKGEESLNRKFIAVCREEFATSLDSEKITEVLAKKNQLEVKIQKKSKQTAFK